MAKLYITEDHCQIKSEQDVDLLWSLDQELSYKIQGAEYTKSFQKRVWDGRKKLLTNRLTFPNGLRQRVVDFYAKNGRSIEVIDLRRSSSIGNSIEIMSTLKAQDKEPYPYQLDAVAKAKQSDYGIIRIATGGGKCSHKDSLHITNEGILDYTELLHGTGIEDQNLKTYRTKVATPLTNSGVDTTSSIYYDGLGESFHIKTSYGFELKATPDHKIQVLSESGNMEWKRIEDIQVDDYSVISPGTNLFGNNNDISMDDAYWYGLLIGDGGYSSEKYVGFTNQDDHIKDFVREYSANSIDAKLCEHDANYEGDPTKQFNIHSVKYRSELRKLGFKECLSTSKTIPESLRRLSKPLLAMVIRGIYETDGWVGKEKSKPTICIGLSSKKLVDQLHLILLNFGIIASRRVKPTTHADSHILTIYRSQIPRFMQEIGLDLQGHKYKKIKNAMSEMDIIVINSNTDIIPNQSHKIQRLVEILKVSNKQDYKDLFKKSDIEWKSIRSWKGEKHWRVPSRKSLAKFTEFCKNTLSQIINTDLHKEAKSIIDSFELLTSNKFFFDKIISKEKDFTDNYDFVIPESHSFVSQGFINHNSLVSALLTADIGKSTIVYVIGKDLLHQLHDMYSAVFPDHKIGKIGDGICEIGDINIASVWTMGQALGIKKGDRDNEKHVESDKYGNIRQLLKSAKVHIFDECHVASCDTIQAIGRDIRPEHVYGMSASPWRDDNSDLLIEGTLGKKIVDISASYLIERGYLVQPIIKFKKVPKYHETLPKNYSTIYKQYIVENEVRNNMVLGNAEHLVNLGYQTLVLYQTIAHGKILHDLISEKTPCLLLSGKDKSKVRNEAKEQIESGEIKCIIASKIFDIGVDLPS